MADGTFHEETIDSCLSIFPGCPDPQDLSPVKQQDNSQVRKANPTNTNLSWVSIKNTSIKSGIRNL